MKAGWLISLCLVLAVPVLAQQEGHVVMATVIDGDTVPYYHLNTVYIAGKRTFKSKRAKKKYDRLRYNVTKVYPYANMAGRLLYKYEDSLRYAATDRERKRFYKKFEDELRSQYEGELKNLSVTQGRILIRLIDRETGATSYNLVKDLRSGFTAVFWQGVARMFGNNLKTRYDPTKGEDMLIESIMLDLEARDPLLTQG